MCFHVPNAEQLDPQVFQTAYVTGIEGIPWPCVTTRRGDQLIIQRDIDESGKLHIVWPTRSFGNVTLMTTSLRVDSQVYSLPLEICRGTIVRLRNQIFEWQRIGLRVAASTLQLSEQSLDCFLNALTMPGNPQQQAAMAQDSIELALRSMHELSNAFSAQMLEVRKQNEDRLSTLLGITLAPALSVASVADAVCTAFNMVCLPVDLAAVESSSGKRDFSAFDKQMEWARTSNLRICCGPLMRFRPGALPSWMVLLGEGFESILSAACAHAEETVTRYRGKVHLWNCGSSLNVPGELNWNDEQVLRLAVSLIQTVRRTDPRAPVLLSIDQPWSEYLSRSIDGISPLHFADALIRADLGLSGLALELNLNAWPDGSLPRDPLEISRLVDRWSMLGLPLMVILTLPSEDTVDASVLGNRQPVGSWKSPMERPTCEGLAETIVRLLVAKQSVHALIMGQATDQLPHEFPHSGLWDLAGKPKPLLSQLAKLRQQFLS
ncbi:MAG: hypothetical protein IT423_12585 [Pirellulaceae bacterium]|nr:hypothetical protein [Pirellulaceae bacterium]